MRFSAPRWLGQTRKYLILSDAISQKYLFPAKLYAVTGLNGLLHLTRYTVQCSRPSEIRPSGIQPTIVTQLTIMNIAQLFQAYIHAKDPSGTYSQSQELLRIY